MGGYADCLTASMIPWVGGWGGLRAGTRGAEGLCLDPPGWRTLAGRLEGHPNKTGK